MTDTRLLIRSELADGIVCIRLNRPSVNALSATLLMDFAEMIDTVDADRSVRAIVIDSSFKVFSAGLDLKEAQDFDIPAQHAIVTGLNRAFTRLFACSKPTIVLAGGPAIAGGLFFVLAADLRIATAAATFGLAEVRVGADFPVGPMEIARATLAPHVLRRLMLTGRPVDAATALADGIIDEIVAPEDLRAAGLRAAGRLADLPGQAYASIKRQIRGATIEQIERAMADGANTPENGWFTDETRQSMRKMLK